MVLKRHIQGFMFILIGVLLPACATMPPADTLNKKIIVMEMAYQEVLRKSNRYLREKRLDASQKDKLTVLFSRIERARTALKAAQFANAPYEADNQLTVLIMSIAAVRDILVEMENDKRNTTS